MCLVAKSALRLSKEERSNGPNWYTFRLKTKSFLLYFYRQIKIARESLKLQVINPYIGYTHWIAELKKQKKISF